MSGIPTEKAHYPHIGVRRRFCPERLSAAAGGTLPERNPLGASDYCTFNRGSRSRIPHMEIQNKSIRRVRTK